ncbi:MAG: carbohydrate kinase family protein [Actinobacteria bacterium]|nr:carbohydrate kinase family protein [Actinomycetota bacterium]
MIPDLVMMGHVVHETIQFPDKEISGVLGSPVAYSSVVAAKLGAKVGVVTKIGRDMPPDLLKPFYDAGVDMEGVIIGDKTTNSLLVYDREGDKNIYYPQRAPEIFFVDIPKDYLKAKIIYICIMDRDVPIETIKELRKHNLTLAIDLGGYGGAHSRVRPTESERKNPVALRELVGLINIARASVEDCRYLLGIDRSNIADAAELFVKWGAEVAVISLGEDGSIAATSNKLYRAPAFREDIVDATGAGDTFSGGFLVEYLRTKNIKQSLRFGNAVALHVCKGTGGVTAKRMPTREEVDAFLNEHEDVQS